jgi:hypothetical protein
MFKIQWYIYSFESQVFKKKLKILQCSIFIIKNLERFVVPNRVNLFNSDINLLSEIFHYTLASSTRLSFFFRKNLNNYRIGYKYPPLNMMRKFFLYQKILNMCGIICLQNNILLLLYKG